MIKKPNIFKITQVLVLIVLWLTGSSLTAQGIDDLSFGTDTSLEVMTWNIEWFPKNGQVTVDYVTQIIEALDIDLLAIQEVDDTIAFRQMVNGLSGYEGYLESSWFAGLAYIYKTDVIQINDIYEIYTTEPYWSPFPRSPMVMDLNFMNERIIVINNHFKCCGDGILDLNDPDDEETRRYYASDLLKEYIDTHFPDVKTMVLGDLNDILTDDTENNVFQLILDDEENYLFADYEIAFSNSDDWSYPTWPSHLDHILITNELYGDFGNNGADIQTIKIDEYMPGGWEDYNENISDHRPVAIKLIPDPNVGIDGVTIPQTFFSNYPNPFNATSTFSFNTLNGHAEIEIYNINGQIVFSHKIPHGQTSLTWNAERMPNGIYFARLLLNKKEIAGTKLILMK